MVSARFWNTKSRHEKSSSTAAFDITNSKIELVAETGFEPVTFGL
jgi:hypothetical protein